MKKIIFLLALFAVVVYPQSDQTVDFVEIQKIGASTTEQSNGYTWANSGHWNSKLVDIRNADSLHLFVNVPDSFGVLVTAKLYTSTDTTNGNVTGTLDSIRNISGAITTVADKVVGTATTQFWTTLKAEMPGGLPAYAKIILTFSTTLSHASTGASATEYFKLYAKIFRKPTPSTATSIR